MVVLSILSCLLLTFVYAFILLVNGFEAMLTNNQIGLMPTTATTTDTSLYWAGLIFVIFGVLMFCFIQLTYFIFKDALMERFGNQTSEISLTSFVQNMNLGMTPQSENYFTKNKKEGEKVAYEDMICAICMDKKNEILLRPCNHTGFCKTCIIEQIKQNHACPICRKDIQKAYTIFYDEAKKEYMTNGIIEFKS